MLLIQSVAINATVYCDWCSFLPFRCVVAKANEFRICWIYNLIRRISHDIDLKLQFSMCLTVYRIVYQSHGTRLMESISISSNKNLPIQNSWAIWNVHLLHMVKQKARANNRQNTQGCYVVSISTNWSVVQNIVLFTYLVIFFRSSHHVCTSKKIVQMNEAEQSIILLHFFFLINFKLIFDTRNCDKMQSRI